MTGFYIRARELWTEYPHAHLQHADWTHRSVDLYIHHTADPGPAGGARASVEAEAAYLRSIERFHVQTRGWHAIGYSYVVMPSGRVWEGRGLEIVGAHTLDPKDADGDGQLVENRDVGICFAGNYDLQRPTAAQLKAYGQLVARLKSHGVRIDRTYPHRACYATSCPGQHIVEALGLRGHA